jgi:hydroxymethylpyrimidine pyrophosphatase-like HAD family hydrolase
MRSKNVCVDFDGVIADYSQGFQGPGVYGEPLPGCAEMLRRLKDGGWHIVVCTSRRDAEMRHIKRYLERHGIPHDVVTGRKPGAHVYVDDRALPFDGDWARTLGRILDFEPYYYRDVEHMLDDADRRDLWLDAIACCEPSTCRKTGD